MIMPAPLSFRDWYPGGLDVLRARELLCQQQIHELHTNTNRFCLDAGWGLRCASDMVVHCLIEDCDESWKARIAASAIILGILPTLLSLLGSTTTEYGLVSFRKPILTFLLGLGAPAVSPLRILDDEHAIVDDLLRYRPFGTAMPLAIDKPADMKWPKKATTLAVVLVRYLLAAGAAANVLHTTAELGLRAVGSMATEHMWLPAMWNMTNGLVLVLGIATLRRRVRPGNSTPSKLLPSPCQTTAAIISGGSPKRKQRPAWLDAIIRWFTTELHPIFGGDLPPFSFSHRRDTLFTAMLSWLTCLAIFFHLFYGTIVFSTLLFISPEDSFMVTARLFASAVVSRLLVAVEISSMRACQDKSAASLSNI